MAGSRGLQWVVCGGHAITSGGGPDVYATLPLLLSSGIGDQTPVLPCPLLRSWRDCGMAGGVMGLGIAQPPDAFRRTAHQGRPVRMGESRPAYNCVLARCPPVALIANSARDIVSTDFSMTSSSRVAFPVPAPVADDPGQVIFSAPTLNWRI